MWVSGFERTDVAISISIEILKCASHSGVDVCGGRSRSAMTG